MAKRPEIFALVVAWNGAGLIRRALDSLRASTVSPRVLVVDNASTDDTVAIVRGEYPEVTVLEMGANLGFGAGNNRGLAWCLEQGAQYVLLLNQDAWLAPGALEALLAVFADDPRWGVLSPVHLNGAGTGFDPGFARYVSGTTLASDLYVGRQCTAYPVDYVNAAAWLVSRHCLLTVGGFDPLFRHYGEDVDYCQRVRYHRLGVGIVPQARAYHGRASPVPEDWRKLSRDRYHQALAQLKDLSVGFCRALFFRFVESVGILVRAAGIADFRYFRAEIVAAARWAVAVPRVVRSRRTCRRPGPHWLRPQVR